MKRPDSPVIAGLRRDADLLVKDLRSEDPARAREAAEGVRAHPVFHDLASEGEWIPTVEQVLRHRERLTHRRALDHVALEAGYRTWHALVEDGAAETLIDRAWDAVDEGELRSAWQEAASAIAANPDAVDAYAVQGMVMQHVGSFVVAEALYRKGVEVGERALGLVRGQLDPEHEPGLWFVQGGRPYVRCLSGVATALRNQGRHAEAVEWFRMLLAVSPQATLGARYDLVRSLFELGEIETARSELRAHFGPPEEKREAFAEWMELCVETALGGDPLPSARHVVARQPEACHVLLEVVRSRAVLRGADRLRLLPSHAASRSEAARELLAVATPLAATSGAVQAVERAFREAVGHARRTGGTLGRTPFLTPRGGDTSGEEAAKQKREEAREFRSLLRRLRGSGLGASSRAHVLRAL